MLNRTSKYILIVSLSALVGTALIDPSDEMLHLKMPLFILVLIIWAARVASRMVNPGGTREWVAILLFAFILPGWASIVGLLGSSLPIGDPHFAILKSSAVIMLIPVITTEKIDMTKHIVKWSFLVAAFTLALALISLVAPLIFDGIYEFASQKDNVMFGSRNSLGLGIGDFYYKTVAVLVFPVAYFIKKLLYRPEKLISCTMVAIFLAAILCSESRATAIGTFIVIAFLVFQKLKIKVGLEVAVTILLIILTASGCYSISFFRPSEYSNAIKLGHIHSYAVLFNDHPTYLLWGQGADTEFYSQGFQAKTTVTELSYLELVRQFGIPVTMLILAALLFPALELTRRSNSASYLAIPYCAYLFEAGTNPLLISSTGLLIVSAIWGIVMMPRVKRNDPQPVGVLS